MHLRTIRGHPPQTIRGHPPQECTRRRADELLMLPKLSIIGELWGGWPPLAFGEDGPRWPWGGWPRMVWGGWPPLVWGGWPPLAVGRMAPVGRGGWPPLACSHRPAAVGWLCWCTRCSPESVNRIAQGLDLNLKRRLLGRPPRREKPSIRGHSPQSHSRARARSLARGPSTLRARGPSDPYGPHWSQPMKLGRAACLPSA
jgi:hypothetical protein